MALVDRSTFSSMSERSNRPAIPADPTADSSFFSPRSRKQFTLFAAGATFFALSMAITKRSLLRRQRLPPAPLFHPSTRPLQPINGPVEAVEAVSIATINVTSFMMMVTGGALWSLDISNIEDARRKLRGGLGIDGSGRSEKEAEEEFEEWLATTLARKEAKARAQNHLNTDEQRNEDKKKSI